MSGLLGSIVGAILNSLIGMIDKWITGKQLVEAQTEAKAKQAAMESVAEAKSVETAMEEIGDYDLPPVSPRRGQKWVGPGDVVHVWTGSSWEVERETEDADLFGDRAWNTAS